MFAILSLYNHSGKSSQLTLKKGPVIVVEKRCDDKYEVLGHTDGPKAVWSFHHALLSYVPTSSSGCTTGMVVTALTGWRGRCLALLHCPGGGRFREWLELGEPLIAWLYDNVY